MSRVTGNTQCACLCLSSLQTAVLAVEPQPPQAAPFFFFFCATTTMSRRRRTRCALLLLLPGIFVLNLSTSSACALLPPSSPAHHLETTATAATTSRPQQQQQQQQQQQLPMASAMDAAKKRVVIVGGGPAGGLMAVCLSRSGRFEVDVFEALEEDRISGPTIRSWNVVLFGRGVDAIKSAGVDLQEEVSVLSAPCMACAECCVFFLALSLPRPKVGGSPTGLGWGWG